MMIRRNYVARAGSVNSASLAWHELMPHFIAPKVAPGGPGGLEYGFKEEKSGCSRI